MLNTPAHRSAFLTHSPLFRRGVLGAALCVLPSAFSTMTTRDPTWNMDTGASSHLNLHSSNLSTVYNKCLYPSVCVGDGKSILVTNTGHSILPTLNLKDFLTRHILLRCDSSGDLYPVTQPSLTPHALLSVSTTTWHQRLGYPGEEVLRSLNSR
ncbi:hypothetical protein Tco_1181746 [Tanacetum coccineum]